MHAAPLTWRGVRTLVISDLHLGARLQNGVLTRPQPLRRLLAALDGIDRLVLLGDSVELLEGRTAQAMETARPVLEAIGSRMGDGRQVILVPGNHDRQLISGWIRAQGAALATDATVPLDATPLLGHVTSWLSPARVRVHYPGVWLTDRVFATLAYFDGVSFARSIDAPAFLSAALMDPTCPPSTVYGAFHELRGEKDIALWEYNGHDGGGHDDDERAVRGLARVLV